MTENEQPDAAQEPEIDPREAELAQTRSSLQRMQADYQNLRRRIALDTEAAVARSKQSLLAELLLVLDYLEMALAAPCASAEGRNLHAGVELTRQQLWQVLEREGVKLVPETGRFDAAVHQAVERVETASEEPGTILATLRRGYTLGAQILRPAHVRVAGPAAQAASQQEPR